MDPTRVIFCLPGNRFSGKFLECWTNLLSYCFSHGIQPILSRQESCNIYYVRNLCLGADVNRGPHQKPFNGEIPYDYLFWIDSDIIFTSEQFAKLLSAEKDIISGIYMMSNGREFATVKHWDESHFTQHGRFEFLTQETIPQDGRLMEVSYTGMGFMMVKHGVFERLEYPWFRPVFKNIGNAVDFTMEDVAFCLAAREAGFQIHVDPTVRVGHEKQMVL